jgi:putative hemolysin
MIAGVMRLADRTANALMTPRREVEVVNLAEPLDSIRQRLRATRRSRLPVQDGDGGFHHRHRPGQGPDRGLGTRARPFDIASLVQEAPVVLDRTPALDVLRALRASERPHDAGLRRIRPFRRHHHRQRRAGGHRRRPARRARRGAGHRHPRRRLAGSSAAGWRPTSSPPSSACRSTSTPISTRWPASCCTRCSACPPSARASTRQGWRFEVVDLDGRRIDKILATRIG